MTRVALFCPPFYSHLRVFEAVAGALRARGATPCFLMPAGAASMVQDPTIEVFEIPRGSYPEPAAIVARAANPRGVFGILRTVSDGAAVTDALCAHAPAILRREKINAVVGDELEPAAGLVADHLGLPFVSLAAALPTERAPGIPLPFLNWPYDPSEKGLSRNRGGEQVAGLLMRRQRQTIARWATRFGLEDRSDGVACLSNRLRLAQTVPSFDFPRPPDTPLAPVGPIRGPDRRAAATLPFPIQPGKPIVFASLGTLQGHRIKIFRRIASACAGLGVELVVAHCGGLNEKQASSLQAAWAGDFLPLAEVLRHAAVCITHGGLNTVLDTLESGTPPLVLPIAFDQPGVGARIVHHRLGLALPPRRAKTAAIASAIETLLADNAAYRERIAPVRAEIASSGGAEHAADLILRAISEDGTATPVSTAGRSRATRKTFEEARLRR